ncbi:MAG: DNA-directed RNA polymerase subunit omega [Lachnospiraceae bacterium]|nr:DNA-directed RNA polymerase subunit omega [Lachnospiraceae bacterium]
MIHPSYVDLMKVVNQGVEEGEEPIISSRYSIVMATARRARQLVAGDDPLVEDAEGRKALSVAVEELNENKIKILTDEEKAEMQARMEEEARAAKKRGRDEENGEDAGENTAEEASADGTDPDDAGAEGASAEESEEA